MTFDVTQLADTMIQAARGAVQNRWPQMQDLAEVEFRRLAQSLADVADLVDAGKIDESRARKLAHIHQITSRSVLATVEGLGLLTAEQAMRSAIGAVAKFVNGALKFALL